MRRLLPGSLLLAALLGTAGLVARTPAQRHGLHAGVLAEHEEGRCKRARALVSSLSRAATGRVALSPEGAERGYDVLTYDLAFDLDPAVVFVEGRAVIRLTSLRQGLSEVRLDLDDAMTVRSVERDGVPVPGWAAAADSLRVPLDPPLGAEERATLVVRWGGTPHAGGALAFWNTPSSGPAVSSLAQPFDARTFWPCVDDPADKAVTTVAVTVPGGYVAVSAGLGSSAPAGAGKVTFTWRLPQPIPTYLVSLAVARFETITAEYRSLDGTRTMPVVGYVVPEHVPMNRPRVASMVGHLEVLASLFGEYPFLDTKYGIVEGSFSGGMEHPTITLIGASLLGNPTRDLTSLLVHEAAHQWWGDEVTMRTWDDIWLNEGFATYSEVLYAERASGLEPGRLLSSRYDDGLYAGQLAPRVVAPAEDPFRFTGAVYAKGGWVLHMLRRLVGDETFFATLREYRRRHERGNATRADLRAAFEEVSGRDLKQFFDQWVETPYRPVLRASFRNLADGRVEVTVRQSQGHAVVHPQPAPGDSPHYRFPLVLRAFSATSAATTALVDVTQTVETFTLPAPGGAPAVGLVLDPDGDLLKIVEAVGPAS
jgi:aminopeptidase N